MNKISSDRVRHMHIVAEYMYENAYRYDLDKEEMYVLGLMHDIGYVGGSACHEEYGASMLREVEFYYSDIVKYHGLTPSKYKETVNGDIPRELVLLWEADMHVTASGELVSFEDRLNDIKTRHGEDSEAYKNCCEVVDYLRA